MTLPLEFQKLFLVFYFILEFDSKNIISCLLGLSCGLDKHLLILGLTLVFGVLKILNIAHGSFYALGAYAAASFVGWGASLKWAPALSLVAMLLAAIAVAVVLAPLTERGLLRFFYGRDEVLLVLVTYAMFLILDHWDRRGGHHVWVGGHWR